MVTRNVRAPRNPYNRNKVGGVSWAVAAEDTNVIKVTATVKGGRLGATGAAVVRGWLAAVSTGLTPCPPHLMPSGGFAVAAKGVVSPGSVGNDVMLTKGTLVIDAVPEKFKTTSTSLYRAGGAQYSKAATTALVFSTTHVITASKFGVVLVQINAAGTVSTKVPAATQAYNTAALALAALPIPDVGKAALGYIAIANNTGDWTATTDDLTNASDVTTAAFVDAPECASGPTFIATLDSNGQFDLNITETAVKSFYVVLELPGGELAVSPVAAFA